MVVANKGLEKAELGLDKFSLPILLLILPILLLLPWIISIVVSNHFPQNLKTKVHADGIKKRICIKEVLCTWFHLLENTTTVT